MNQLGGGPGAAYSVNGVLVPGMPYLVNNPISNCQATAPDYALRSVVPRGLPGFSGGGQVVPPTPSEMNLKGGKRSRKMRGGVYAVDPVSVGGDNTPNIAATFDRIACSAGVAPHVSPTVPTQPGYDMLPGAAPSALRGMPEPATITTAGFQKGGQSVPLAPSMMNLKGGALQPPYSGSPVLQETTAGYTHLRNGGDVFVTQGGVAEMINVPSGGRLGVPDACVRTHGGRQDPRAGPLYDRAPLGRRRRATRHKRKARKTTRHRQRKNRNRK
jgi:hypothetical protein